jgi:hypothetical protein
MSQVTIYMDDDAIARAKAAAAAAKLSLSSWLAKLVKEQTQEVDSKGWPVGFFENILKLTNTFGMTFPAWKKFVQTWAPTSPEKAFDVFARQQYLDLLAQRPRQRNPKPANKITTAH